MFKRATRKKAKLRLLLAGVGGSGKTISAIKIARGLVGPDGKIAVADTENGSAAKFATKEGEAENPAKHRYRFDSCELALYGPMNYIKLIDDAVASGYDVLILDGITQEWAGKGGCLELNHNTAEMSFGGNTFRAWGVTTPLHNKFLDAIVRCPIHIICTVRSEMDHVQEKDDKGSTVVRRLGLAPVQRKGIEYEFDMFGDINDRHDMLVRKSRCPEVDRTIVNCPDEDFGRKLAEWLSDGSEVYRLEPEILRELFEAFTMAKFGTAQIEKILAKRGIDGADNVDKLTKEQALDIIKALREKMNAPKVIVLPEPEPEVVVEAPDVAAPPEYSSPPEPAASDAREAIGEMLDAQHAEYAKANPGGLMTVPVESATAEMASPTPEDEPTVPDVGKIGSKRERAARAKAETAVA